MDVDTWALGGLKVYGHIINSVSIAQRDVDHSRRVYVPAMAVLPRSDPTGSRRRAACAGPRATTASAPSS